MTPSILYKNLLLNGVISASSTAAGYNVLNVMDPRTFTYWMAGGVGIQCINIEFAQNTNIDSFAIINHNLCDANATISFQYMQDQDNVWISIVEPFTVNSNNVIFRKLSSAQGAKKFRIMMVTANIAPKIAVAVLGTSITFPYAPDAPYIPISESFVLKSEQSKTGHVLGNDIRMKPFTISARFTDLPGSMSSYLKDFWRNHASDGKPFIYAFNSDAFYVRVPNSSKFELPISRTDAIDSFQLDMEGVIR